VAEKRGLYPTISPKQILKLRFGLHQVHVEECGREDGIPVVFLHGGPGSSCKPYHRQFFDPARYRIVLFDQRGAGQSLPHGETRDNTLWTLLSDMERIRESLNIERWVLFGGSWGATLALAYAQQYASRVLAMIIRGTFLARERDLNWFYADGGVNRLFPDSWQRLIEPIPVDERGDLVAAYYRRVQDSPSEEARRFAGIWSAWGSRIVTSSLNNKANADVNRSPAAASDGTLNEVRIETYYAFHRYFLAPNQLLRDIRRLPQVPTVIIHGRRDLTCTMEASWVLHNSLSGSELIQLESSGHLANETDMIDALVTATDAMAERLGA
jgi:proline iminopeptidase